jgi:hypothetical protein
MAQDMQCCMQGVVRHKSPDDGWCDVTGASSSTVRPHRVFKNLGLIFSRVIYIYILVIKCVILPDIGLMLGDSVQILHVHPSFRLALVSNSNSVTLLCVRQYIYSSQNPAQSTNKAVTHTRGLLLL